MDMEIDPEIAAAMGFSSFGGPTKKRKFGADEAVADVQQNTSTTQHQGQSAAGDSNTRPNDSYGQQFQAANESSAGDSITLADGSTMSLRALRSGIRNERGDIAYFLPSFLEDPWEKLAAKKS